LGKEISDRYIELYEKVSGDKFIKHPTDNLQERVEKNILAALAKLRVIYRVTNILKTVHRIYALFFYFYNKINNNIMYQKISNNILETIGNTPLVKINSITKDLPCTVLAKVETTNPGNSIKDRMALKMIEDAEKDGRLKPGGTIIEGTSGNTGMGLAIAAIIKGYKCIFTTTDKQSKEKVDALRAFGAEVVVCPTDVEPEDPRSYYSVSSRLVKEVPNSWKPNQYDNK
jgi:hypothetical protein